LAVYESTQEVRIQAPPQACFGVLSDYERMPEWQSRVAECNVLSRDERGRGKEVEYVIDVKLRRVRYRLRHTYEEPEAIGSEYLGGDFRRFEGDYRLQAEGEGTCVTFHLRIDPGLRVPGPIVKMLNEAVMGRALQDLRRRVEQLSSAPG
jgi:ribosome-associated toxin RatA of RatAB toxin-antitoxin module